MTGPLNGVRVIELAGLGAVPHAAMVLTDLGADVLRINRTHPDPAALAEQRGVLDHGRPFVRLDLRSPSGRRTVLDLVRRADVVIEGFRPGVAERLGVGPVQCMEANPRLVYARMTGWGQTGPLAGRAGHDLNFLAVTGTLSTLGRPGEPPTVPLNLVADFGGGSMLAVVGVLAALFERTSSGLGQVVDAAMVDGVALLSQLVWDLRANGSWVDERGANLLDGGAPFYRTYQCADGRFVAVAALEDEFYDALTRGLGLDPRRLPDRGRTEHWPELRGLFAAAFGQRSRDQWAEVFEETDACVTPVVELSEAAAHPQMAARGTLVAVGGRVHAGSTPRLSRTPGRRSADGSAARVPPSELSIAQVLAAWPGQPPTAGPL